MTLNLPIIKTRFAPSPTGHIHLGNARTALFSALAGDKFLLRIEDTDKDRSRIDFVADLIEDLTWMGLSWDEGPRTAAADEFFQSERAAIYSSMMEKLVAANHAYPCFCSSAELEISRKRQLASGKPPRYQGNCHRLTAAEIQARIDKGLPHNMRFRVTANETVCFDDAVRGTQRFLSDTIGDFILQRSDGSAAFFFTNAIDDALMNVNLVVRGEDHLSNTPRQLMILAALGLQPPNYAHISLVLGDDGAPLSKRNGSVSIRELRNSGYLPLAIINMLARIGHHYEDDNLLDYEALSSGFCLENLGRSPSRFDHAHLNHWQQLAMRQIKPDQLVQILPPGLMSRVPVSAEADFLEIIRTNCLFPHQALLWADVCFSPLPPMTPEATEIAEATNQTFYAAAVQASEIAANDPQLFMDTLKSLAPERGKALFQPLRAALSGRLDGPELGRIYALLTRQQRIDRLNKFALETPASC